REDVAVEARRTGEVHADAVRAGLSLPWRGDGRSGSVSRRRAAPPAGTRPGGEVADAVLQGRRPDPATLGREHPDHLPERLESPRGGGQQPALAVAVDPEERRVLSLPQPPAQ